MQVAPVNIKSTKVSYVQRCTTATKSILSPTTFGFAVCDCVPVLIFERFFVYLSDLWK